LESDTQYIYIGLENKFWLRVSPSSAFTNGSVVIQLIFEEKKLLQSTFMGFIILNLMAYTALQRKNAENWKQIFPEKEYRGLSPNFHIHVSVSDPTMELPFLWTDPGNI
jgi:hypothetical protein